MGMVEAGDPRLMTFGWVTVESRPQETKGGAPRNQHRMADCEANKEIPFKMPAHEELLEEFEAYGRSVDDAKPVILMQHISQRLHEGTARYNWVGFYLMEVPSFNSLVLGPHVGSFKPTLRIPLDKGLCGVAATSGKTVVVNNVGADPRYLGSDLVKSNIVAPIFVKRRVVAELCIESYFADTFTASEQKFIESCAALVGRYMEKEANGVAKSSGAAH
jgi:L-methionine (R)-S-oxide reductase